MEPSTIQYGRGLRKRITPARFTPVSESIEEGSATKKGKQRRISGESAGEKTPSKRKVTHRKGLSPTFKINKKGRTMKGRKAKGETKSEKSKLDSFVLKDFNEATEEKQVELIDNLIGQVSNLGLAGGARPRNGVEWVLGGIFKPSETPAESGANEVTDGLKKPEEIEIQQLLEREEFSSLDFFEVCKNYKLGWWGRDANYHEAFHNCKGGKIILEHMNLPKIGLGRMDSMEINGYLGDLKKYLKTTNQVFETRELLKLYHKESDMKTASGKLYAKFLERAESDSESEADDS